MKKLCLVILMFIICVPLVKAETEEELQQKLDNFLNEKYPNDTIELNSINPNDYNDKTALQYFIDFIENEYYKDGIITSFEFKENYTKATITVYISIDDSSMNKTFEKTKEVNIKWKETNNNYKNKILEIIKEYSSIPFVDMYTIKSYLDLESEKILTKLNEIIDNEKITYKIDVRAGDGDDFYSGLYGFNTYIFYDNILYGSFVSDFERFKIIYISQDTKETKEDYINAAQTRINKYYPNLKLENSDKIFTPNEKLNKFIDKDLNSTFDPVTTNIKINGAYQSYLIVKGTNSQLTDNIPKEFISQNNNQETSNTNNQENNNQHDEESNNQTNDEIENPNTGTFIPTTFFIILLTVISLLTIKMRNKKKLYKI